MSKVCHYTGRPTDNQYFLLFKDIIQTVCHCASMPTDKKIFNLTDLLLIQELHAIIK